MKATSSKITAVVIISLPYIAIAIFQREPVIIVMLLNLILSCSEFAVQGGKVPLLEKPESTDSLVPTLCLLLCNIPNVCQISVVLWCNEAL